MKVQCRGREKQWDYSKREYEPQFRFEYDKETWNIDGCHLHIWVPVGTTREEMKRSIGFASSYLWDVVCWSWDFIPKTV